jgi:hypothetical protein
MTLPHRIVAAFVTLLALIDVVLVWFEPSYREYWYFAFVIGIPTWFAIEHMVWQTNAQTAKYARDFWLAISVFLAYHFGFHN